MYKIFCPTEDQITRVLGEKCKCVREKFRKAIQKTYVCAGRRKQYLIFCLEARKRRENGSGLEIDRQKHDARARGMNEQKKRTTKTATTNYKITTSTNTIKSLIQMREKR